MYKQFVRFSTLAVAVLLLSCQGRQSGPDVPVFSLQHELLLGDDYLIGRSKGMALLDDSVPCIITKVSDGAFLWLDYPHGRVVPFGRLGQGPDECLFPSSLHPEGASVGFWDVNRRRYAAYDAGSLDESAKLAPRFTVTDSLFHFEVYPLCDRTFIAAGLYEDFRFARLDASGRFLEGIDECPYRDAEERAVSGLIRSDIYQGRLAVSPSGDRVVHASLRAEVLAFYRLSREGSVSRTAQCIGSYPSYSYNSVAMQKNAPVYYLDVSADDRRVYVLYSGRNYEADKEKAFAGDGIHVYDWEGKLLCRLRLDVDIESLCVTSRGDRLYAIALLPNPVLVSFPLPEVPDGR